MSLPHGIYSVIPPATRRRVLAGASAHFGVEVDRLLSRERVGYVCEARQMVMAVLYGMDYTYAAIGRALERDHSTVLHGIHRALATPEQEGLRDLLLAELDTELDTELDMDPAPLLSMALAFLPPADAESVRCFVERCCLHDGGRCGLDPRAGLFALARRPWVAARVERVLTSCGSPGAAWLLHRAVADVGIAGVAG